METEPVNQSDDRIKKSSLDFWDCFRKYAIGSSMIFLEPAVEGCLRGKQNQRIIFLPAEEVEMDVTVTTPGKAPGFVKNPDKVLEFEPSPRRIRINVNGEDIVDSTNVMLMREGGHVPAARILTAAATHPDRLIYRPTHSRHLSTRATLLRRGDRHQHALGSRPTRPSRPPSGRWGVVSGPGR